jgi:two-component system, chemotaxis family, CheB/CheR fusion protein
MPDDLEHFVDIAPRAHAFHGVPLVRFPANTNLSVGELLSRNGALAAQNLQLMATLARLTADASTAMARLTPRQQQVMDLVLAGHPNKNIAADLNISQRTVENHRAAIMSRTGATSLPALVRLSLGAE